MSEVELPPGWTCTTLGAVTRVRRERVEAREARGRPYVGLEGVERDTARLTSTIDADVRSDKAAFKSGDVLYSKLRPNLNKVWRATSDGICSTEFIVLRHLRNLDPDWLAFRLLADDLVAFATAASSSSLYPRITYDKLIDFQLALPPLGEQTRIARRVKILFDQILEAGENLDAVCTQSGAYRRSLLERAFSGDLSEDWRAIRGRSINSPKRLQVLLAQHAAERGPNQSRTARASSPSRAPDALGVDDWLMVPWSEIGFEQNGRAFPSNQYADRGVRLLRPGNLSGDGSLVWPVSATRHLPEGIAARHPALVVGPDEVIINLTAQSLADDFLGRVCITGPGDACLLNQRLARLHATGLAPRFLFHMLRSPQFRRFVDGLATGSLIQHMSTKQLADFAIPVPTEAEQTVIVDRLDAALAAIVSAEGLATEASARLDSLRRAILARAAAGNLVRQHRQEGTADETLRDLAEELGELDALEAEVLARRRRRSKMGKSQQARRTIADALAALGPNADARSVFDKAGYEPEEVGQFYEELLATPEALTHFRTLSERSRGVLKPSSLRSNQTKRVDGHRFRLVHLWIGSFKNLRDYRVEFDPNHSIDIVLGWNGTGKSNLFEALVVIFRDLFMARGKSPATPFAYLVRYEIGGRLVEVSWSPGERRGIQAKATAVGFTDGDMRKIERDEIPLPRFVFGYYSGPTNRLAEHFLPLDREHYARLVDSTSNDPAEILRLLEERRFFCAETHHAKYVMLGYFHKEDELISRFLRERLRIVGFGAAVFVIKKPSWAKPGEDAETFWGATGVVRHFLERLRRIALAPLRVSIRIDEGFRQPLEEQLHFLIPDATHLRLLADEYPDARAFFLALESTDFSRMVRDVRVSVVVDGEDHVATPIIFREMSEGEQQLLTVLGLLRFTRAHDSLVLLDEPDTHLNPHWSVDYLDLLGSITDDDEQGLATSQILMSTHDPLVIVAQEKEQIHLLKRTQPNGRCEWRPATESPRGLGFTGILTSDMFGFGSDLDKPTLDLLHDQAVLAGKDELDATEQANLDTITAKIEALGFRTASSDPYYRSFLQAVARREGASTLLRQPFLDSADMEELASETDDILAELDAEEAKGR